MTAEANARQRPWAFWAPAPNEAIDAALALADLGPDESFVDLGCGDGRVLVAAARRGASVRGYEVDPGLADAARRLLEREQVSGEVLEQDLFGAKLGAEVLYAYLTPALLVRLAHTLTASGFSGRLVTPRYALAGCKPTRSSSEAHLYEFPLKSLPPDEPHGWRWRAIVARVPARRRFLIPTGFVAAPGPLAVALSASLARVTRVAVGEDQLQTAKATAIDLQFEPCESGSVVVGEVSAQACDLTVAVVYADGNFSQWNFGSDEGQGFRERLELTVQSVRASRP